MSMVPYTSGGEIKKLDQLNSEPLAKKLEKFVERMGAACQAVAGPLPGIASCARDNFGSIKNFQCIASNVLLEVFWKRDSSAANSATHLLTYPVQRETILLNLPLRAWNCLQSYRERDYIRIALDVSALMSLFLFPNEGRKVAIFVDLASELFPKFRPGVKSYLTDNSKGKLAGMTYGGTASYLELPRVGVCGQKISEGECRELVEAFKKRIETPARSKSSLLDLVDKVKKLLEKLASSVKSFLTNDSKDTLTTMTYEEAVAYLELPETEVRNRKILEEKRRGLAKFFERRIKRLEELKSSLAGKIRKIFEKADTAYKVLLEKLETGEEES